MNVFYGKAKQQNQLEENARNKQTENTILNNHSNPVLDMMDSGNIKQQLNYSQEIEEEIDQFEEYINVDSIINDKIYNPSQNYDYQNVIKANPLLHNKGSSLNITVIQFIEQEQALSRSNFVDIEEDKEFSDAIRPQKNKFNTDSLNGFVFTRAHYSPIGKLCGSLGKVISSEDLKFLSIRSETPRMESKKSSRKGTGNNRDFGNILVEDLNNHNQQPIISGRNASPTKQKMGNNFIMPNTGVDQMSPREMKSPKKLKIVKFTRKQSASGLSPQLKTKKLSLLAKSKSGEEELPQIENSNFKQKAKRMETEELKDSKQQLINKKTLSNSNVRRKTADLNSSKIISEQNSEADQNLMKRMPSILKKRTLYQKQVTPTKQQSSMLIQQAKKQVRFNPKTTIHEYEKLKDISDSSSSEESEENNFDQLNGQIIEESKNYLYNKKDIELLSQVKKPFHKFIIPPDDPVFKYDYNYLFFKDRETKKRFYTEYKVCKGYFKRKARLSLDDKTAKTFKKVFQRRPSVPNFTQKPDGTKKHTRKTLVFDLDNTLIKSAYKKHKLSDYDSYIYVNILGNKRIRRNA
ncbi:UNKNOWN [Stylonychia lemnae]|uniref:Uncharacterized protein n=1 Tax=Stylonychia lemnae TaxID=5949 RepID=A0A077ZRJ3_STYLE|nr:UNKNOWN [Stylonychia lemnae]|eukprot:CDW71955.1 UNKNOWN [Stylonychia lemnae]